MDTDDNNDPAVQYAESVELERAAWQELHAHPPGSPERLRAWNDWDRAIGRTNRAWRSLSASRIRMPGQRGGASPMGPVGC